MTSRDDDSVQVPRATLDQLLELLGSGYEHDEQVRQAGYREGQAATTGDGYRTGYDLGHDTGYSAREDTRGYVHGILDGWTAGCAERRQLAEHLTRQAMPARARPQRQAEREAG